MKILDACLSATTVAILSGCIALPAHAQQQTQEQRGHPSSRSEATRIDRNAADITRKRTVAERNHMQARRIPVIGVLLAPDEQAGVRIAGVTPDSAASKSGLQAGDRIVTIDGAQVLGSSGALRVQNARKLLGRLDTATPVRIGYQRNGKTAVASVTPKLGQRIAMLPGGAGESRRVRIVRDGEEHVHIIDTDHPRDMVAPHAASEIRKEIIRIGPGGKTPRLLSAFRWNGLNLASVDPQLGRYFGTDKGVLVLSSGDLDGLQSGDVIQSVDGRPVESTRDVMDAMRDKPANARVAVGYLRDRRNGRTNVTIPEVMRDLPLPPAPPAPPAPPNAPAPAAPPALPPAARLMIPPAPPAPPAPPVFDAGQMHCVREGAREICTSKVTEA